MPPTLAAAASARLHIVTGKGGVGKTTVAAALALALAAGGGRTLLVEVEGRQGIARVFDTAPLPYDERRIARAAGGGEVRALAVDPEEALLDYLELFYNLRRAGSALKKMGAVDFATTIAPGMRDVLLIGKVKEATTRMERGRHVYDAVVLDAPPTGRIGRFLNVTAEVAGLTKVGPIAKQSVGVTRLLTSQQATVHLVSLLEEMPVQEAVDAAAELTALGVDVGSVLVNMRRTVRLPAKKVDRALLVEGLHAAGLPVDNDTVGGLLAEATEHIRRAAVERRELAELRRLDRPVVELPFLTDGIDPGALADLADLLRVAGMTR